MLYNEQNAQECDPVIGRARRNESIIVAIMSVRGLAHSRLTIYFMQPADPGHVDLFIIHL